MINVINGYFVNQTSSNDCGLACLTMILKYHGMKITLDELKKKINIGDEMSSVYDLIKFSKKMGVDAAGYKKVSLDNLKYPCIVHVIDNEKQHFIVALKALKNKILIADPASRIMYVNKSDFIKKYTGIVIMFEKKSKFVDLILKNKMMIFKILVFSIILAFTNVLFSFLTPVVINNMNKENYDFKMIITFFLFLGLLKDSIVYFKSIVLLKFQLYIDKFVTLPTINKIINLPHTFYHYNGSGELISKINDLSYIKDAIFAFVEVVTLNSLIIISGLLIIFFIDKYIVMINLFFYLLIYFINKSFIKNDLKKSYDLQHLNEKLSNEITDCFGAILMIKNLVKEKFFKGKITNTYNEVLDKYKNFSISYQKKQFIVSAIITLVTILMVIILIDKKISVSIFLLVFTLQTTITSSILELFKLLPLYANFKNTYVRINDIYNKKELVDTKSKINFEHIQVRNVKYGYGSKKVLSGVSFSIDKGDWIMVNGPTGSGKSTMFKLITKQIPYSGNAIRINDINIANVSEEVIRNTIVYVDQKVRLINSSIKDNICMGDLLDDKAVSNSLVKQMLKENKIDYDYKVDNTSSNLSGGQISKIVIAQALNVNRNVIIFDETTSNLDPKNEEKILNNIKKNYKDKTIILITHRQTNVKYFNKIITFENGKIINLQGG